ncbi:AAA family ATPase [Nostoc sp. FACHB-280]|uniref:AAA family ATPase n=1 Tax=Nostoc sp. FACHB-280 TaxID=2692839 RepID=UPI00168B0492|nr:AAA family ATPase [Nostoc sp. FACHB-280]MBD2494252.1 AAA family ATPase [Nostoc sp. FACHB-280]
MTTEYCIPLISGYQIIELLYAGSRSIVYRAIRQFDRLPVVIKVLTSEHPTLQELLQFRHQYSISKNLDIPGIIHPLALETYKNSYILVMADTGGIALREYIKTKFLSIKEFLAIALQLTQIIHDLHQNRVIHKDIKPANILIHPQTQQIQLIDFSIASLLPKETQEIKNPNILEGTLAYISPEQTGRMNRGIDYRSDFYSLGVTFYELLTGNLPFICDDPMELVHCHIAKQPDELNNARVPQVIAEIVMKLMAKNAEDRYQTAVGLKFDLEKCLTQYQSTGRVDYFKIGEWDICDRFLIPEKLYGREIEVKALLNSFARVSAGTSELMLVAGFSGIGKTAVINEVHQPILQQQGYFIKGKFEQFSRNIPFSGFVQACRDLIGQLLSESDIKLQQWQTKILAVLGENAQVLIDVIPELELIIGQQATVAELAASAAQNRLNLLFQKFINLFTTAEHPCVIFLDDLQWADLASLELIKVLIQKSHYLLVLGAYRDSEVSPTHPLMLLLEELRKTQAIVNTITLNPLTIDDINHLLADTLNCSLELAKPLTELINRKTQGNPFFTTQFLKALHEEKYITFNRDRRFWECDLVQVNTLSLTDDMVQFMALQLQKLPDVTQKVLKLAACIGNTFDLATIMIISELSPLETATALWKALQQGLIVPTSQVYKLLQSDELGDFETENSINPTYQFLHDRIQKAAYSLIPNDQKQITHYKIGQQLLRHTTLEQQENKIFDIVNHLHHGINFITQQLEKDEFAKLNLIAGKQAKISTDYQAAIKYFKIGLSVLSDHSWQNNFQLKFSLYKEQAECEYLLSDFVRAEELFNIALQHSQSIFDQADIYESLMMLKITQGEDFTSAIKAGLKALDTLGMTLPNIAEAIQPAIDIELQKLESFRAIEIYYNLLNLPVMTDPNKKACMKLLSVLCSITYLTGSHQINQLIRLLMLNTSLEYGNCENSGFGYCFYGMALIEQGEYQTAYQFGKQALELDQKFNHPQYLAQNSNIFCHTINPYIKPLKSNLPLYQRSFDICHECGDLVFGVWAALFIIWTLIIQGKCLADIYAETEKYSAYMQQVNDINILQGFLQQQQFLLHLQGRIYDTELLANWDSEEINCIHIWRKNNFPSGINWYCFLRIQLSYIYGNYADAVETAIASQQTLVANGSSFPIIQYHFYYPLSLIALYPTATPEEKQSYWHIILQHQQLIKTWANNCPENFLHKYHLLAAEIARLSGNISEAIDLYDRAIAGAIENEYLQEAALSNELAAKFYLDWGKEKIASVYMQAAYYYYASWGAIAKTEDLEYRYPDLLRPILQQINPTLNIWENLENLVAPNLSIHSSTQVNQASSSNINTALDFTAIIKASQALSSTIDLDELLQKLTEIILQNSGADYCALILPESDGNWHLKAIGTPESIQVCFETLENNHNLPIKLINYVKNTQEIVTFDNLQTDLPVISEYLNIHRPKSVLCLPILNQRNLIGIVYLRNQYTSEVFTRDRVLILEILCTQAAISLENARLHAQEREKSERLEKSQQRLQIIIQQTPVAILEWNTKFEFQNWNPAAEKLFGYTQTEIMDKHLRTIIPEEYHAYVDDVATSILSDSGGSHAINENVTKDGRRIICEWFNAPMLDVNGEVCGGISIGLDISEQQAALRERQQAEAAIHKKSQELETALQELKQAQLQMIQNEKMASLGNLVAGVAHEVNNPIGFLNGSISNAQEYVQDLIGHLELYQQSYAQPVEEIQENAEEIDLEFLVEDLPNLLDSMTEATQRIKSISTSLRTFSRADTDSKVTANIHDGLDSTLLILKYRLKANEKRPAINIQSEYGNIPLVECFPGQLNQVFMNILANAIDMFDEMAQTRTFEELQTHPQQITIRTQVVGSQVNIHIQDNGKGMSAEVQEKIFDHLFTTKGVGKGTGLGMAIAKQIVEEKHGGQITVYSVLGEGTEFIIQLPV